MILLRRKVGCTFDNSFDNEVVDWLPVIHFTDLDASPFAKIFPIGTAMTNISFHQVRAPFSCTTTQLDYMQLPNYTATVDPVGSLPRQILDPGCSATHIVLWVFAKDE